MMPVLSRQWVVGRAEACESVGEELDDVVFELAAVAVIWRNDEFANFHFTFHFGFSLCETLFWITHSVRGVTMSRLDRLQIDC
jgi:hypothetical protein